MLSLIGLLGGLALLIVLTMRGMSLFVATPLCALLVALTSGIALLPPLAGEDGVNLVGQYMNGFTGFIASWFFIFLLGSLFGKLMESSGGAESVAHWIIGRLGSARAALAVVLACAVLTYGGVSLFVVAFSVYPMALALFRDADLPRRFIPATMAFGSVTFTMTSAGSPEIQNWIPIEFLGTSPLAAWQASLVVAIFMAAVGYVWLTWMLDRAVERGESFESRTFDPESDRTDLPHPALRRSRCWSCWRFLHHPQRARHVGADRRPAGGLPGRRRDQPPPSPRAGRSPGRGRHRRPDRDRQHRRRGRLRHRRQGGTGVRGCGRLGHAPSGQRPGQRGGRGIRHCGDDRIGVGRPGDRAADPRTALHRSGRRSGPAAPGRGHFSGALDSLPHNGYVVTTIRAICGESHAAAYPAMAALTVLVPLAGLLLCLGLFAIGL